MKTVLFAALLALAGPASAQLWGFVDERGAPHFAAERLDERYELFLAAAAPAPDTPAVPQVSPRVLAYFELSAPYKAVRPLMREAADAHGLDYELLKAVVATESGFDPRAVSPKGAVGLMQLMPATAVRYGVPASDRLTDPRTNLRAGARYLADLLKLFNGDTPLALAAYNAGEGAVMRAGRQIPDYRETRQYVASVMLLYRQLLPPPPVVRSAPAHRPAPLPGGAARRGNLPQ